jgi:hypothetical protein
MFAAHGMLAQAAVVGASALAVNYIGTTAQTGLSFSSIDLGTPAAGRILVFGYGGYKGSNLSVSGITAPAGACTQAISVSASNRHAELWYIEDAVNGSGNVTVSLSGSSNGDWLDVWEILGASAAAPAITTLSGSLSYGSQPLAAIGVGQAQSAGMSLTGFDTDYDDNGGSGDHYHIGGSSLITSLGGSFSVNGATTDVIAAWS